MIGQHFPPLSKPVVYVCRDLERATGIPLSTENYFIITNSGTFAKSLSAEQQNVLLIEEEKLLDTHELLKHPKTIAWLTGLIDPRLLVFKNTTHIEKICRENDWELLNPPAELARRVEEKISQLDWLGPLQKYLPPHQVVLAQDLVWTGKRYIAQFNHAHTGLGTLLIDSSRAITGLKKKFPKRSVRVTDFINGPAFTNNNIVWGKKVLVGNINYQITGLAPFTTNPFTTIGNDWTLPHKLLTNKQIKRFKRIATDVGKKLMKDGWKGLFGIDTILDQKTGRLYLIEINARQPASTTFESVLQFGVRSSQNAITTFEAHLGALLNFQSSIFNLQHIKDGAQIIQRIKTKNQKPKKTKIITAKLKKLGCDVITYDNREPGSDWLRIQSRAGIMARHNQFNALGKKIKTLLA